MNLLFDLDGTLADPLEAFAGSMDFAFDSMSLPRISIDVMKTLIGPPLHLALPKLFGPEVADSDREEKARQAMLLFRQHHGETGIFKYRFYEGMDQALAELHPDHRIFVATSKPRVYADKILRHFGKSRPFEFVYGSELSGVNSKKGDLISFAMNERGLRPEETVMIGDRKHDVIGARENGIPAIGVLWGYGNEAELREAGAVAIVKSWDELVRGIARSSSKYLELNSLKIHHEPSEHQS